MRIIGVKINDGNPFVLKNLSKGGWYPLGDYNEPCDDNSWQWAKEWQEEETLLNRLYRSCADDTLSDNMKISVNCIIGSNGSGKSTLLDVVLRILNNLACQLLDKSWIDEKENPQKGRHLSYANGLNAILYFEADDRLFAIYNKYDTIELQGFPNREGNGFCEHFTKDLTSKRAQSLLKSFFYTVITNYSIYAFNEDDYESKSLWHPDGIDNVNGHWLPGLFHKNDAYLSPFVLVPYRKADGQIEVGREKSLAKQRLATLALLFKSQGKKFMDDYEVTRIAYRFNRQAGTDYRNKFSKTIGDLTCKIEPEKILNELHQEWEVYLSSFEQYKVFHEKLQEAIKAYLCYKSVKICVQYRKYGQLLNIREPQPEETKENGSKTHLVMDPPIDYAKSVVKQLTDAEQHSHILLKVHQMIEFVKRGIYKVDNNTLNDDGEYNDETLNLNYITASHLIKNSLDYLNQGKEKNAIEKRLKTYDEAFLSMPPSIFDWDVEFKNKGDKAHDALVMLSQMSSGQKQLLQSFSYVLYHIKNIESVSEEKNTVKYHHINLVFDEAELYYHPEYQREFVSKLIKMLSWCHIDGRKIRSLNFIIVTHSPFVLSDVPTRHCLFLKDGKVIRPSQETFGANIHDLLYNQFFLTQFVGNVASDAAKNVIETYRKENLWAEESGYCRFLSHLISEPYMKKTLSTLVTQMEIPSREKERELKTLEKEEKALQERLLNIQAEKAKLQEGDQ